MLDEGTKDRIRVHLGIPVDGIPQNGYTTGYRFFEGAPVGALEYRMNNLKPFNESEITGFPIGTTRLYGNCIIGDIVSITLGSSSPVVYTVTNTDIAQVQPLFSVAQNIANAFNAANASAGVFATFSPPIFALIGSTPVFAQVIIQAITNATFTFSVSFTGKTSIVATRQGILPQPQFINSSGNLICGYVPMCDYFESQVAQSDSFAAFETADVVKFSQRELLKRIDIYYYWRRGLAKYLGIPINPMGTSTHKASGLAI